MKYYDEPFNRVYNDLEEFNKWVKQLKFPKHIGAPIKDSEYLKACAIHVLTISQLEYFLKQVKKIDKQCEIVNTIEYSALSKQEQNFLVIMFYLRHCIVHNGTKPDQKCHDDLKKKFPDVNFEYDANSLVVFNPKQLLHGIKIIQKLVKEIWDKLTPSQ